MRDRESTTSPRANGRRVREMLVAQEGSARLYRRVTAGPSGQRADVCVGRVDYVPSGVYEFQVFTPSGTEAGYAARGSDARGEWTVWSEEYDGYGVALAGWASSLAVAADVLVHGEHGAMGRHDSRRMSGGGWVRYQPAEV